MPQWLKLHTNPGPARWAGILCVRTVNTVSDATVVQTLRRQRSSGDWAAILVICKSLGMLRLSPAGPTIWPDRQHSKKDRTRDCHRGTERRFRNVSRNNVQITLPRNGSLRREHLELIRACLPPELRPPERLPIAEEFAAEALAAQANRDGRVFLYWWAALAHPNVIRYLPESREPAAAGQWTAKTVLSHLPEGLIVQKLKLVRIEPHEDADAASDSVSIVRNSLLVHSQSYAAQVLLIVLVWLLIFALPAAMEMSKLPSDSQATADAYDGIIAGIAVVITGAILTKRK